MTTSRRLALITAAALALAACGSGSSEPDATDATDSTQAAGGDTAPPSTDDSALGATGLATSTPAGTQEVDSITWALYRDVGNLDPVFAFDYPENTTLALMCETPLRQAPDGQIVSGLADLEAPDDTTFVLTIKDGVTFWNGDPVTADDIVFSLERNRNPEIPGVYGALFERVESIVATDDSTVTITMTEPDMWFRSTLASTASFVVQRAFVEAAGADFGNPTGRTMCSGSYQLGDWSVGSPLVVDRNESYWDTSVSPKVASIEFIGAPDPIALSAALQSGDIQGYYAFASMPTLNELKADSNITVTEGAGYQFDAMLLSPREGSPLEDVRVRKALSMAIDRQGYIDTVLVGAAQLPKSVVSPGVWGYSRDIFQAAWDALPTPTQDIEAAKALVAEAGAEGKSFTIGLIGEVPPLVAEGAVFQKAAEDIGLKVEIKAFPADQYISLFIDPAARADVDGFFTVAYPDAAEPGAALGHYSLPGANLNFSGYDNPEVTRLLNEARSTVDDDARAELTVQAQALVMEDLPLIPVALPHHTLVTSSDLTGAIPSFAMMFSPWANDLGGR